MSEAVTSRQLEIAAMLSRNGLYVLGNPFFDEFTGTAVVLGADEKKGTPGRLFQLRPAEELSTDAEAWLEKGTYIAGGPFSVQSCQEQERIDDAAEDANGLIQDELAFWRKFAGKAISMLMTYHTILRRLEAPEAKEVKELLDSVTPIEQRIDPV